MHKKLPIWLCAGSVVVLAAGMIFSGLPVKGHVQSAVPALAASPKALSTPAPTRLPESTPEPFKEIEDWQLVLVGGEIALPEGYELELKAFDTEQVDARIYDPLDRMLKAAKKAGLKLWVASGYRDKVTQKGLLEKAVANRMADYGMSKKEATANALRTIAKPGYSEHHTGLAVDFNYVNLDFEHTEEYRWLAKNAAVYGFVQRYSSGKEALTGIDYEPWHYRYVGRDHAQEMNRMGLCLEEYIDVLKTK